jgi:hypothetical protein
MLAKPVTKWGARRLEATGRAESRALSGKLGGLLGRKNTESRSSNAAKTGAEVNHRAEGIVLESLLQSWREDMNLTSLRIVGGKKDGRQPVIVTLWFGKTLARVRL